MIITNASNYTPYVCKKHKDNKAYILGNIMILHDGAYLILLPRCAYIGYRKDNAILVVANVINHYGNCAGETKILDNSGNSYKFYFGKNIKYMNYSAYIIIHNAIYRLMESHNYKALHARVPDY